MSVFSVSGLVEQQVQEDPDAVAVHYPRHTGGGVHLTYRELSRAANRLAAHLRARGIGRGDRVVTSLRPGPQMVTAFLGTVRAGAALVPVAPADPAERRRLIVRDSAAAAVLAEGTDAWDYAGLDTAVVALDAEAPEIARCSDALPEHTAGPDAPLCVHYTDGTTTGAPEGIVVPHRAVLDLVRSAGRLGLTPADAVAQAAGPASGVVTFEVWAALAAGARLVGLGEDTAADPDRLRDSVRAHGISVLFLTAAQFDLIARERPAALGSPRTVLLGGETCDPRRVREVSAQDARNHEGPCPDAAADAAADADAAGDVAGPDDGFTGWTSSYDGLPIPPEQLREWRDATLDRIRELPRRRVLEIGAGSGSLMDRLARDEEVDEYWATDPSPTAVAALTARVEGDPVLKEKVRLDRRGAADTSGLPAGHFDAIVLGSVVRHFPDLAHLRTVIERALPLLAPGGSLVLTDLRSLDLARCFRTGIALARPGAARGDREALLRGIDREVAAESELLLSPALFDALARDLPAVRAVDVRAKRGRHHNELTRYRYDAVLSTAEPVADLGTAPVLRWGRDVAGALEAEHRLAAERPAVLRLAGVPNRRVHDEYTAMRSLFDPREGIDLAPQDAPAPGPEELCRAAERLGYRALLTWGESPDLLDIVLVDPGQVPAGALTGVYAAPVTDAESCADVPPTADLAVALDTVPYGGLRDRLPDRADPPGPLTLDTLHSRLQDRSPRHTDPPGPLTLDTLHSRLQDRPPRHTALSSPAGFAVAAVPEGWYETHSEDLYDLCIAHINDHLGEPF